MGYAGSSIPETLKVNTVPSVAIFFVVPAVSSSLEEQVVKAANTNSVSIIFCNLLKSVIEFITCYL